MSGWSRPRCQAAYPNCSPAAARTPSRSGHRSVLRLKKHARVHQARQDARPLRARSRPTGQPAADGDGRLRRAGVRAARDDADAGAVRAFRQAPVQAPRDAPLARAQRASARARSLDGRGRRAARRPRGAAQAAVLRGSARDRSAIAASASESPPSCAPRARRTGSSSAVQPCATACSGCTAVGCERGEGNPLPSFRKGVFAPRSSPRIWQLPSIDYLTRAVCAQRRCRSRRRRPRSCGRRTGAGTLRDALGAVSIHPELRRQNTAVPGTVEQGKSSYLVATVAEDLRRERCAVIVLDPKGDAAEAARERSCRSSARARCWTSPTRRAASTRSPSTLRPT